jgi:hypothetical protein
MPNLVLILFLVFVVSIGAGWLVYVSLQRKQTIETKGASKVSGPSVSSRDSGRGSAKTSVLSLGTPEAQTRRVQDILVSSRNRQRGCPKCERRFSETYVLCPHDGTPLIVLDAHIKRVRIAGDVNLPTCAECGRHYEGKARYCRKDGKELQKGLEQAVRVEVCEACGAESSAGLTQCCAEPQTYWVDPSNQTLSLPVFPMLICPMCHKLHAQGASMTCSEDGAELQPLIQLEHTTLAPLGVGPRRKICGHCGRRYSGAAHFCVMDGAELNVLN